MLCYVMSPGMCAKLDSTHCYGPCEQPNTLPSISDLSLIPSEERRAWKQTIDRYSLLYHIHNMIII